MSSSDRMKDLLLAQFDNKPNIAALLNALGKELDKLDEVREEINTEIYPDTAIGAQLDLCGEVAGIDRKIDGVVPIDYFGFPHHGDNTFGEARFKRLYDNVYTTNIANDEMYRLLIKAKIAKNCTDGSRESSISSLKRIFGANQVTVSNAGNAKAKIGIGRSLGKNEIRLIKVTDLAVHGAGIGIDYYYYYEADKSFGFSRNGINGNNFIGMGKLNISETLEYEGGHYLVINGHPYFIVSLNGGIFSRLLRKEDI